MKTKGSKTRNQEIPMCPLRHKKLRNHVHTKMKRAFTAKEPRDKVVIMDINVITDIIK